MSEENEEKEEGSFKVKDKRRFDEHGNARSDSESASPRHEASKDESVDSRESVLSSEGTEGGEYGRIDFGSFVMSLATQALMQMGEMPGPEGLDIPVNVSAAKQTIDILGMLEEKTSGNLDAQEARLMKEMLHTLRMSFLNKS